MKNFDGFVNFLSRVGLGTDNVQSAADYVKNDLTKNRARLDAIYRTSWVAGAVVDCIAEDMTRAGVDFAGDFDATTEANFQKYLTRKNIWHALYSALKWARLYGGAVAVIDVDGQDLSTPLNLDSVQNGAFRGLRVFDRWELQPDLNNFVGIDAEPESYMLSAGARGAGLRIHHSRVLRFIGLDLPSRERSVESGWGASVLERLYDRLVYFDNVTAGASQLVEKSHLRVVKIDGFRDIMKSDLASENVVKSFHLMRQMQSNEGLTLLDKNDDYQAHSYTFGGLSEMVLQFGQQISGACGIPLVRLFGQSPAGLNSTGESDLRLYYDNILTQQESRLRENLTRLFSVCYRACFGTSEPADFDFNFKPLWQMSAADKTAMAVNTTNAVMSAYNAGLLDAATALQELKSAAADTGLFNSIGDDTIAAARLDNAPIPADVEL